MTTKEIIVKDINVRFNRINEEDYICLTDLAKKKNSKDPNQVIANWLRTRSAIDYLSIWETLNNPDFNPLEIEGFRKDCSLNSFTLSPTEWVSTTNAIGITAKSGRYGGTYAHRDIALKFASWISVEFELYLNKEFQRLKMQEQKDIAWDARPELAKLNYHIHTDAIKENLLVPDLTRQQINFIYANEADVLNVALFGVTAAEWRTANPALKGNLRDYASIEQLLVLANLESYNAVLVQQQVLQSERLVQLNQMAKSQLLVLSQTNSRLLLNNN